MLRAALVKPLNSLGPVTGSAVLAAGGIGAKTCVGCARNQRMTYSVFLSALWSRFGCHYSALSIGYIESDGSTQHLTSKLLGGRRLFHASLTNGLGSRQCYCGCGVLIVTQAVVDLCNVAGGSELREL